MDKIDVMGMSLPVLAELEDGWVLAAHRNGPVIAREGAIAALHSFDFNDDGFTVSVSVYAEAVQRYVELTWERVKCQLAPGGGA